MAWRLALACDTLRSEIKAETPNATIYTIGDQAHASRASDHNPNSANVVCAIDIMGTGGVNMPDLAERIRARQHLAGKYLIYNRRIAKASEGWAWRSFDGDPHTDHIHVSVGVGPDGRSTGPYDNTDPWLEGIMAESYSPFTKPTAAGDRPTILFSAEMWRLLRDGAQGVYDTTLPARGGLLKRLDRIEDALARLEAKPTGDVDEAALAVALAPLIDAGATPAEVAAAVRAELDKTRLGGS